MEKYTDTGQKYDPTVPPYPKGRFHYGGNPDVPFAYRREDFINFVTDADAHDMPVRGIVGPTGSGKTSVAPLALAEMKCDEGSDGMVIVGEPRKYLARQAYERMIDDVAKNLGLDNARTLIGRASSEETELHPNNIVRFVTHGYGAQEMLNNGDMMAARGDDYVSDEHHLREVWGDVALGVAKRMGLTAYIMSATPDLEEITRQHSSYDGFTPAPIFTVEGRQHDIEHRTMDSSTMAAAWAASEGLDTLYNLMGKPEIESEPPRIRRLTSAKHVSLALHGEQSASEQALAMKEYDLPRMIAATNIADNGVTMSVDVVVNPGLERVMELRSGVPTLVTRRTSKATDEQRAGRAGRDKPGLSITAPFEGAPPYLYKQDQKDHSDPEILTTRTDGVLLRLKQPGLSYHDLQLDPTPPEQEIARSEQRLRNLGALSEVVVEDESELTEIGREMAQLPLNPDLARMVVESRTYDRDIQRYMMTAVAVSQNNGIAIRTKDKENWRRLSGDTESDLLRDMDVYIASLSMSPEKRQSYNLIDTRIEKVQRQLESLYRRAGFDDDVRDVLPEPTAEQRQQLISCAIKGIEDIFIRANGNKYKDTKRRQNRKVSPDSSVSSSRIIAGNPWNKEDMRPNTMIMRRMIKNALSVTPEQLMAVSPERCSYKDVDYELGDDEKIYAYRQLVFDDVRTGHVMKDVLEVGTPGFRQFVVDGVCDETFLNEGSLPPELLQLRREVLALRDYDHRSLQPIGVEEMFDDIRQEVSNMIPADALTLEDMTVGVDSNFIRSLMTNEHRRSIEAVSPEKLTIQAASGRQIEANVSYKHHEATITVADYDDVRHLPTYIPELDGRRVHVCVRASGRTESYAQVTSGKYAGNREQRRGRGAMQAVNLAASMGKGPAVTQATAASRRPFTPVIPR